MEEEHPLATAEDEEFLEEEEEDEEFLEEQEEDEEFLEQEDDDEEFLLDARDDCVVVILPCVVASVVWLPSNGCGEREQTEAHWCGASAVNFGMCHIES